MYKERINYIQSYLKQNNIDAYLVFNSDDHGSEYIAPYYKTLKFLCGFSGSAATLLILQDEAFMWTDGRYFIQAERQLKASGVKLMKMGIDEPILSFISNNVKSLAFDYKVASVSFVKALLKENKEISLVDNGEIINEIWNDRPLETVRPVFKLDDRVISKNANKKCQLTLNKTRKGGNFGVLVADISDVAYLTNLRGFDIDYNPVFTSFMFLKRVNGKDTYTLYVNENKIPNEIKEYLESEAISIKPYNDVYDDVKGFKDLVYFNSSKTNYKLFTLLSIKKDSTLWPTSSRAIKTNIEIKETKRIHVLDGVAMVRFINYVKSNVGKIYMDEITIADKLEEYRREMGAFELSFDTICGYLDNGAIIHYSATDETKKEVKDRGLLLVDSGGQYYYGTTDITRTLSLGNLTSKEKYHFTLVLKSHIALASAYFKKGKTDKALDKLARKPLHEVGLDYRHGTGHGIGFCLNVHEGPQSISVYKRTPSEMKEGMITSNEPGLYFENEYGIRHENEILCVKKGRKSLAFETITYVPFDLDAIEESMLTLKEKQWLNNYHKVVYKKISPYLNDNDKAFLRNATREI